MKINILDLFSGIGGFAQGLSQAGFNINKHYTSEIDKHAKAIYKHKFPESTDVGDVRHVRANDLERIDAITFGSPCQDFSLAGKRKGMQGERSSLITEAIRLIDECRPKFFAWENVKGTFSSNNGADFWAIIKAFADLGNYRIEWQLLNTAWLLPQNRERIYLVGTLGNECGREVFPIREDDFICDRSRETAEKIYSNNRTALTQQARQFASWNGDFIKVGTWANFKARDNFRESKKGVCPTILARARVDGDGQPVIQIGAIRGRNPENPNARIAGQKNVQTFEENSKGIANTLTSVQKDTVQPGDSINYSVPTSKTRRGRVGKGKAQTLDTACNKATYDGVRIRRLTEIECERLQGFEDNWTQYGNYDGKIKEVSASQRYKVLGNAVTVDVVQAVGERILESIKTRDQP